MKLCCSFHPMRANFNSLGSALLLAVLAVTPMHADVLNLDGSGDYVTFPATSIPSGSNSFTVEAWINPISIPAGGESGGQMTFWGNETGNQANGFRLRGPTGVRHFFWGNDHDESMGTDVLPNTSGPFSNGWHHFAITWNGSQTRWYWNGAPLGGPRAAAGVNVAAANHRIGARPGGEFFHGHMDEVRIWNIARSANDIASDFRQALIGNESGLVAYWSFEGSLTDLAGGNNNGTAVGNAATLAGVNAPVLPVGPRIYAFTASTNQILLGQSVTLSWAVSNALSVAIDNGIGMVIPSNSIVVMPAATMTYSLTATNTNGVSTAQVSVVVDPGIPLAQGIVTNTPLNTAIALTLRGSDPQGSNLTYSIVTPPANGSLGGAPPSVTYTPSASYLGLDNFTFKVNDGTFDSAPANVSIKVVLPPAAPTGVAFSSTRIPAGTPPGGFIALLTAIDVNEFDTHTFSLAPGFGDNANFVLNDNLLRAGLAFAGDVGSTFNVRVRATDNTGRSGEQTTTLVVVEVPRTVVINEIHYNGTNNSIRDSFIELYNNSDSPMDLSQWLVRGGIDFFLPTGTILPAHGFVVVAEDPATIQSRFGVSALGPWTGGLNNEGEDVTLRNFNGDLIDLADYRSTFPWPIASDGNGPSTQLINPSLDNELGSSWRADLPTPGATNAVFSTNAAPNIRQVNHAPEWPVSSNLVAITARVTDPNGVASVTLAYQVVAPGSFIPSTLPLTTAQLNSVNNNPGLTNQLNPTFEAASNWVSAAMSDTGLNGDAEAGDGIYTVVLPPQANRTLVRYRVTVTDALGASRRAPFEDDPSLNFAYFVYDGVPNYLNFTSASLKTLPVYFLITRDPDLAQCTAWNNTADQLPQDLSGRRNQGRLYFNWEGAFVYEGKVHDHVTYRLRGANGRYHPGKRSFRIRFNDGALFQAYDNNGRPMPTRWREVVTGKGQSNRGGEQFALNEVVNFFLWNKVGVPAPRTLHFHFRVIRGVSEAGANQYSGDFWGLNWAQEKYDREFLESHDLPPGNLYKLVDNYVDPVDEIRYFAPNAPRDGSDFNNIEFNLTGFQSTDWLNAHANYTNWFRYFAIAKAIRHYDTWPSANKNGAWYFEPRYGASNSFLGRVMQLPYDSTDTWGATWNNGDDILFDGIFPSGAQGGDAGQNPEMQKEYRNTIREIRALLLQPDQINPVIDAFAGEILAVARADHARWSNAPAPASYASLLIPGSPGVTGGLPAYQQDMKNFMFNGGNNAWWIDRQSIGAGGWVTILDTEAADAAAPTRPTVAYVGTNGYPIDGLVFQSSDFADPQGTGTYSAMQWRVAEVLPPGTVVTNTTQLRLEWDAAWTSEESPAFNAFITIPPQVVQAELLYRVRVRHKDDTGRWSAWSLPAEFRAGPRDLFSQLRTNLVFNEIMYNPPGDGAIDGDEFEFIELKNIGAVTLNLTGLSFTDGIDFAFPNGTTLAPGATFLLARNANMLVNRYPGAVVNGIYSGRLNNDGETLTINHPAAGEIVSVTYADLAPWPVTADGFGFSLVRNAGGAYVSSAAALGTPGADGGASLVGGVVINEILSASTLPLMDAIELLNIGSSPVDISGWYLTDDPGYPWKFRIPAGPALAGGAFRSFDENAFNPTPGAGLSFSLSSLGDDAYLFSADAGGQLTGYSHGFSFGGAQDGVSFGRHMNSVGDEQFPLQLNRTPNAANGGPRVGPVVISEIHFNPRENADEFIELRNLSGTEAKLYDVANPTNAWQLAGLGFDFPTNAAIAANGYLLLVADNPTVFRARFGVPASVPILQYAGNLQDSGENLEVQAPDAPSTNGVPYYAVDTVRYNDRKPWPLAADGAGASLQRINISAYGNDPINWLGASPTPGGQVSVGTPPVFTTHPASATNSVTSTVVLSANAAGTPPLNYQWRFNGGNLAGATNSTLVVPNVQLSQAGTYQAVVFNAAGSADSSNAVLVVRVGATITSHPTNVAIRVPPDAAANPTNRATFTAAAISFNPPLRYQWRFNGIDIPGETNSSLSFTNVQLSHEGAYTVVATDSIGSMISQPATLSGLVTPQITVAPVTNLLAAAGETVSVSAAGSGNPLPFAWEWRRGSTPLVTNTVNERFNFFSFINSNAMGSTQLYRVLLRSQSGQAATAFNVITLVDSDSDGIPDSWEQQYFGGTNSANPALDADSDGLSNRAEYQAGTNPTNAASFLRVSLGSSNSLPAVAFGAEADKTYTIQFADELGAGNWRKLGDVLARTNSRVETLSDPAVGTNRFYRAVTPRQP